MTETALVVDWSHYFTLEQVEQFLRDLNPRRVNNRDGNAYLEAHDVRCHLIRCLGFGRWSEEVIEVAQLFEQAGEKTKDDKTWTTYSVGYRATVKLTICAPDGTPLCVFTEAAAGDATNFPENKRGDAHDFAIKTAESQALKRCAVNLGTQFGLSLYQRGQTKDTVGRTLLMPPGAAQKTQAVAPPAVDEHVSEVVPEGPIPPRDDVHEQSAAPIPEQPGALDEEDARALAVASLVAQLNACKTKSQVGMVSADIGKKKLLSAHTADGRTLGAVLDEALKRCHTTSAA